LNTVPIQVPPLRDRKDDIFLLFRKFAADFADKYKMPVIHLMPEAQQLLIEYRWPGNVRQLKNVTEQLSILEQEKEISADVLIKYLPGNENKSLMKVFKDDSGSGGEFNERELLYKVLFDMKKDLTDLKKVVASIINGNSVGMNDQKQFESNQYAEDNEEYIQTEPGVRLSTKAMNIDAHDEYEDETLSLSDKEKEMINKALDKYKGKRKDAAKELGISERTLYRKIKEYDIKG